MRKRRFSEAQIIGVLGEQESRARTAEVGRRTGSASKSSIAGRRNTADWARGRTAPEELRGREPAAEAAAGGIDAGRRGAEGPSGKRGRLHARGSASSSTPRLAASGSCSASSASLAPLTSRR
jgi:hypothetical protein